MSMLVGDLSTLADWPMVAGGALALVALALLLHYRYWVARLQAPLDYDLCERLTLADGVQCDLRRLAPSLEVNGDGPAPVLLVHGIAINHRNLDIAKGYSLARYLRERGHDVWLLTLRSGREDRRMSETRRTTFSAMVQHDVPTAVAEVRRRTNAARIDYVGFSMGGMLMYACLGRTVPAEHIQRVVIIGSPGKVGIPLPVISRLRGLPSWIAPRFLFRIPGRLVAFASEWFSTPIHRIPYNPDNVAKGITRLTLVNAIRDVPAPLNREFGRWAMSDNKIRIDGEDVLDGLAQVTNPVRFVVGAVDRLAPERAVRLAFDAWGSGHQTIDKELNVLGLAQGASADYGHGDLALGRDAPVEVFVPIGAFLASPSEGAS